VLLADLSLNLPDFRAAERTLQLLVQVARDARGGASARYGLRADVPPDHPSLVAAAAHDYTGFMRAELERRAILGYPPYSRLGDPPPRRTRCDQRRGARAAAAGTLRATGGRSGLGLGAVLGPPRRRSSACAVAIRRQILLRHADVRALRALARSARAEESALRRARVRLAIDVDPYSMFIASRPLFLLHAPPAHTRVSRSRPEEARPPVANLTGDVAHARREHDRDDVRRPASGWRRRRSASARAIIVLDVRAATARPGRACCGS
jgi:hypothetical protein